MSRANKTVWVNDPYTRQQSGPHEVTEERRGRVYSPTLRVSVNKSATYNTRRGYDLSILRGKVRIARRAQRDVDCFAAAAFGDEADKEINRIVEISSENRSRNGNHSIIRSEDMA